MSKSILVRSGGDVSGWEKFTVGRNIIITLDQILPNALSYEEGKNTDSDFNTPCIQFFKTRAVRSKFKDSVIDNVTVIRKDGSYINNIELLTEGHEHEYTMKEIRVAHDILKLLIADVFMFRVLL